MTDEVPTYGWTYYQWRRIKHRCVRCDRQIRRGVVNINHVGLEFSPSFRAMCRDCYDVIGTDQDPDRFEVAP